MAGTCEPYYWKKRQSWYVNVVINGKATKRCLGKTKTEAYSKWKAMLKSESQLKSDPPFEVVAVQWVDVQLARFERGEVSKGWLARVSRTIERFVETHSVSCSDMDASFFESIRGKMGDSYARTEFQVIKQVLRWAFATGKISRDHSVSYKLPSVKTRDRILSYAEHCAMCRASNRSIKMILRFAWMTGSRPGELRELKWSHLAPDFSKAVLKNHKTVKKVRKPRVIYFSGRAITLLKALKRNSKSEFVFVNTKSMKWTKDGLVLAVKRVREKAGLDVVAYNYRHTWITRALMSGVDVATVAALSGHKDTSMISRVYGHLDKHSDYLAKAAAKVK